MSRKLCYRITLLYYSGKREVHYIGAENMRDAFSKAHRFCNPFDPHDGVQFIVPDRVPKSFIMDRKIELEA